jgi:hypothetical protein
MNRCRFSLPLLLSLLWLALGGMPAFSQDEFPQKTLKFLYGLEQKDGSFALDAQGKADLRSTSAAIRAIRYLGGKIPHPESTAKYISQCFDEKTGGFAATPAGKVEIAITAVGLMAAAEVKATGPYAEAARRYLMEHAQTFEERRIAVAGLEAIPPYPKDLQEKWLLPLLKEIQKDGTFGSVRATGGTTAMLLRAGVKLNEDQLTAMKKQLVEGQAADGGYAAPDAKNSDIETTYRVMRALHLMNARPKNPEKLAAYVKSLAHPEGGFGSPPNARDTYYAAIILYWLK